MTISIKKLFTNKYFVLALWFGLSIIASVKQVLMHAINNYYLYKYSFVHLVEQQNLYATYPKLFFDSHHYGPFFGLIIAPFALMPDTVGVLLWTFFNAWILYKAVTMLPITVEKQLAILLICAHELMTSSFNVQVNPLTTALILFTFIFVRKEKDFWAALMIIIGLYIKLYGIVGLSFFFFSKHKPTFILSLVFWAVVLFVLPMAVSSPQFVIKSYHDWYLSLSAKDIENNLSTGQDISVKGMIRRIFDLQFPNFVIIIPAVLVFLASYIRYKKWPDLHFQMLILASTLIFPVIYSSSSESPTYIIAFIGVAIWFVNIGRAPNNFEWFLLIFALVITSLSPSDLFPKYISTHYIKRYGLKALPCFIIWLKIIDETWTRQFGKQELNEATAA